MGDETWYQELPHQAYTQTHTYTFTELKRELLFTDILTMDKFHVVGFLAEN